ncbi:major facilitator superfamily domain-containing protein [Chytridium lagenaria]|nr:major facilitator superfamily domain-containing protein [Chytridium lagenaria]
MEKGSDSVPEGVDVDPLPITDDSNIPPPPDGGLEAWLVVAGSFMVHFIVLGIMYTFGVYASYFIKEGYGTPSSVSFVGSFSAAVLPALGMVSGRLAEKFGFQRMTLIGAIFLSSGLILGSFCTQLWQLFFTQGLLTGIGSSLCYFPAVSAPSQWFLKKRGLATGIAVSGSGIGGLLLAVVTQRLLDGVGFAWTLRITGIFALVSVVSVSFFMKNRIPPSPSSKTDWSIVKDSRFLMLLLMGFFATFAYLVPVYFMSIYATDVLGQPVATGAALLAAYNGSSAAGRIILGYGADGFMGRLNSLCFCMVMSGLSMIFLWTFATSVYTLAAFAVVNGFVAGGFISLFPVVVATIFGAERLPSLVGMLFSTSAVGNFAGAPLAGFIKERVGFTGAIVYAGIVTMVSSSFAIAVRFMQEKKILKKL